MALRRTLGLAAASLALAACAAPGASPSPTLAPAPTAAETAAPTPDECARDNLELKNEGRLTLSTDIPAYPPWWGGDPDTQYDNEPEGGSGWEVSDPYSMEGLEGATAYAIAEALGFSADEVDWIQNTVFENAFAPGDKPFDFHMAQISIRPERAEAVDFSEPYFDSKQSILAIEGEPITGAATIADLAAYKLGAAANTTSFELIDEVIQPTQETPVYPDNSVALQALANGQINGLVVDLGSALYMRDVQLGDLDASGVIVGQFDESAQADKVGAVLEKGSPLTGCVSRAIDQLADDGTLDNIYERWIVTEQAIPFFE